jgi:hypothetical protein
MRANAKLGFYIHLFIYICVIALLVVINLMTSSSYLWFKWPLLGWGIGVMFHALGIYLFTSGHSTRERMIERELHRDPL